MINVLDNVRDTVINVRPSVPDNVERNVLNNVCDNVWRNVVFNVWNSVRAHAQELLQGALV